MVIPQSKPLSPGEVSHGYYLIPPQFLSHVIVYCTFCLLSRRKYFPQPGYCTLSHCEFLDCTISELASFKTQVRLHFPSPRLLTNIPHLNSGFRLHFPSPRLLTNIPHLNSGFRLHFPSPRLLTNIPHLNSGFRLHFPSPDSSLTSLI